MSLWGATVITNMLSAVPWIGQDFVQFVFPLSLISSVLVISAFDSTSLPTIGVVNTKALRGVSARTDGDKESYISVSYNFLAMFVGLVDGDGYIKATQTSNGFISMELVLSLHINDIDMLNYLKSVLNIGRVVIYPNTKVVKYIIGRVDLQEVLFPLLLHHGIFFLTNTRRLQFERAMYILLNNIVQYADIPGSVPTLCPLPTTASGYVSLPFFTNWIVGFTIAEGSFYVKTVGEFFFSLKQRSHPLLFYALKLVFNANTKIDMHGGFMKFSVSSVKDLTTVVNFFSFSGLHPLIGMKADSYNSWINRMKQTKRFNAVRLPLHTT